MRREEKSIIINELTEKFANNSIIYIADSSKLTVEQINNLRALCYEKGVEMKVVKNTLAQKAFEVNAEERGFEGLYEALKGPTTLLFAETSSVPAKLIKEFRKKHDRPLLKAAYIDSDIFIGDDQVDFLASLKSKEELVGDIILLLQSPIKNVLGSVQSAGQTISGILKALEKRA
jgi:large subunit ribosomal protein L10